MIEQKPFIVEVAAEMLPDNERTKEIRAQRAAAEEAKQLRLEQVSSLTHAHVNIGLERLFEHKPFHFLAH